MGIGALNFTSFHRAAIIAFPLCTQLLLPTNCTIPILVAKIGISPDNIMPWAKQVFGAAKCTVCYSRKFKKSDQGIISGVHLKSFRSISSFFSTPTKAYLQVDGLVNVSNMVLRGFKMNAFPQLEGPVIIRLRFLPLHFLQSSQTLSVLLYYLQYYFKLNFSVKKLRKLCQQCT